ncbi:MAG: hypothetical protein ACE5F5_09085 [Acidimicrobiia bacterium]
MSAHGATWALLTVLLLSACSANTGTVPYTTTGPITTAKTPATSGSETTTSAVTATSPPDQRTTTTTGGSTNTEPEEDPTAEITVEDGTVAGGGLIEVTLGEEVRILVFSDTVDMAHLHGYDIAADVGPGTTGVIEFVADIPGVFELELEDSGVELGRVQVSP